MRVISSILGLRERTLDSKIEGQIVDKDLFKNRSENF
jgi:hypothetical protein